MKNKKEEIEKRVDRTMESIDHIQRVEGNPYLWSKIQGKLESNEAQGNLGTKWYRALNLQAGMAFLLLLGLFNVFTVITYSNARVQTENKDKLSSLTQAYGWSEYSEMGAYEYLFDQ
jgi:hypothetical protein